MRFLQLEWHNHERARNAWDIERAEMKAKIARFEGESKHAKRVNEQLDRQVKMLEHALRNKRAKGKKQGEGEAEEQKEGEAVKSKGGPRHSSEEGAPNGVLGENEMHRRKRAVLVICGGLGLGCANRTYSVVELTAQLFPRDNGAARTAQKRAGAGP